MERHSIEFGKRIIEFDLIYKERKNLRISVAPDLNVFVYAPSEKSIEDIYNKVYKRALWIIKQQNNFKQYDEIYSKKKYFSGETHLYLGRHYRLKLINSNKKNVKLKGKYFLIETPDRNDSTITRDLMINWYQNHAEKKYRFIIKQLLFNMKKYGIDEPSLSVRKMKSRWGSCNYEKQNIILNLELIKAPIHCIEYVIFHELTHLKYPNHDKEFYNFMNLLMPDWEKRKQRLEMFKIEL